MSRRKQSNPQHLDRDGPGGAPPGTTPANVNEHPPTEGADEVNGDVHVCGKCRGEFIIISEFLEHKLTCYKDRQVVIVDHPQTDGNTDEDNQKNTDIEQSDKTELQEDDERDGEITKEENEFKSLIHREDIKDQVEGFGTKETLPFDAPKSEADDNEEAMDFTMNHHQIPKSVSERPSLASIANGLMSSVMSSLPLPQSNLALSNMEHTKFAVSQICHSLAPGLTPPTGEDMAVIQDQLYTLQQQHLQQLQLIQHIQFQVNTYTAQDTKQVPRIGPPMSPRIGPSMEQIEPPKSSSPTPSSTSSTPTLPTVSPPSVSQAPPPPHLLSPPISTTPVLPPSFESPLPPGHPALRPGPPPSIFRPGAFPLPPHRPPFELLQQAAIPPVSSPLHSVPPSPFGRPGGLLGLQHKPRPQHVSIFDAKFTADDPFFRHKCRFCHKVFGSDSALQIHIRSHTGERPFKCNICGNRFSTKGNLKVHFQRHQARYPHIPMDINPHPPSPPPQERPSPMGPSPIHPPSIHQVPMPTIPNDVAKLPMETTNQSHQAVQPSSGSPNMSTDSDEFPLKPYSKEWHPPSVSDDEFLLERPPRPLSEPPRPHSEPIRSPMEPRPNPDENRPASASDIITPPRSILSPGASHEYPLSPPPVPNSASHFLPPSSSESLYGHWGSPFTSTPSSLKLLAEQGFRPSETSKLQELVENIEQKITDPNQCVICHRVLSCKSALQMHYRIHTGERPFRCKICSRSFTTKGNMKTHYGVHRLQPPMRMYHDCPICQKRFTNEIVLHQHLRLHAAEGIPIPNRMNFMRPEMHGQYGPEIALRRPTPMMMMNGGGPPHLFDREKFEREREHLPNGPRLLPNGPYSHPNEQNSDDMQSGEKNEKNEAEMERRNKHDAEMEEKFDDSDEGLTEKQIEEAMFTPSEGSQGDAESPSATYDEENNQPTPEMQDHNERRPSEIDLANQQHRFDHQRSLDNITKALKMKMASAPLNNNTELRGPNDEHFSEPQSPFGKSEENSMTLEKPSEMLHEDSLDQPLHIDESSNGSKIDTNGVLDLTSRSSGEISPSMPQSQGLPTSTAAMFAGLGAPNIMLAHGPGGLIYPPGRRPNNYNTTCRFCGKVFACTSALQIHYRSHTKERPFKCDICGKGFSTRGNLKQHMLTHKIRDLPSQFFDPNRLQNNHIPLSPRAPSEKSIELEQPDNHSPNGRPELPLIPKYEPELPQIPKYEPGSLGERPNLPERHIVAERHIEAERSIAAERERSFVAERERSFVAERERSIVAEREHSIVADRERSIVADRERSIVADRERSIVAERSFIPKPDTLPVHPSLKRPSPPTSRENEPPSKRVFKHQCSVCEKQFQSDSALQIHMRTHTGEKPFKCHICARSFTTKGNMKVHMGTHMWNGGTRRGRRIAFDPPLIMSPKEGFRHDFLGMPRPPFDSGFFQYPSPLNGYTALSKANEISVIQNHQTGPEQARIPTSPNSVIMKADGPNPEMREIRELREMQENKMREIHEKSMRELHENSFREMHENSLRGMHENKIRDIHENKMREMHENKMLEINEIKMRELHESKMREINDIKMRELHENKMLEINEIKMRELHENKMLEINEIKMRELHESKIRELHENSIREMRENTIRDLRENAMREMRENALREMRESTVREMRGNLKPEVEPERLTTA